MVISLMSSSIASTPLMLLTLRLNIVLRVVVERVLIESTTLSLKDLLRVMEFTYLLMFEVFTNCLFANPKTNSIGFSSGLYAGKVSAVIDSQMNVCFTRSVK